MAREQADAGEREHGKREIAPVGGGGDRDRREVPERERVVDLAERPGEDAGADQQPGDALAAARDRAHQDQTRSAQQDHQVHALVEDAVGAECLVDDGVQLVCGQPSPEHREQRRCPARQMAGCSRHLPEHRPRGATA
jgi:hypothetical protein